MISPGFPVEMPYFARGLAVAGAEVIGLGEQPESALPDMARRAVSAHLQVASLSDERAVLDRVRRVAGGVRIDRVECLWEPFMILAAHLREALGLPGMTVAETIPFRDKEAMKRVLDDAGVRTPRHASATTAAGCRAAAEEIGFPVIVKPIAGAGSADTYRVDSASELERVLPLLGGVPIVSVEEFVEGEDYTFDTICAEGRILHENMGFYRPRALIARENEWISPQTVSMRDLDDLALTQGQRMGRAVLEALGFRTGFTHMEWYRKSDGEAVFGEIAARPPGARTVDLMNYGGDFDFFTGWAEAVTRGEFSRPVSRRHNVVSIFKRAQGEGRSGRYTGSRGCSRSSASTSAPSTSCRSAHPGATGSRRCCRTGWCASGIRTSNERSRLPTRYRRACTWSQPENAIIPRLRAAHRGWCRHGPAAMLGSEMNQPPPTPSLLARPRERKLFQVLLLYLGVAWGLAQVAEFLVDNYGWSRRVLDATLLLLALGIPATVTLVWFHGERGHQRLQRSEGAILAVLLLLAGVGLYAISTADPSSAATRDLSAVVDLGSESVAVLPFNSRLQDPDLDWLKAGTAELLTTGMAEVSSIRVVSGQRMFDLLRQEGRADAETIPPDLATRLTRRAGARYMVQGSIYGGAGDLQMRAELIDVTDGTIAATTRVRGADVFALVDRMAADLSAQVLGGTVDPTELTSVASVTSRNLEAYRHYLAGIRLQRRFHPAEALEELQKAVALDSTFALAQLRLGSVAFQLGLMGPAAVSLAAARRYRESAPERDRLFLDGTLAQIDNDREKARRSLGELVARYPDDKEGRFALATLYGPRDEERGRLLREGLQLDPLDGAAINELAYFEARKGNFTAADSLIARYVELEPDEPNPLDSRGEILMQAGRYEAAREQFRAVFRMRPDFSIAIEHLAGSYAEEGRLAEGIREVRQLIDSSTDSTSIDLYPSLAILYTEEGSLRQAVEALTTAHELAVAAGDARSDSRSLMATLPLLIAVHDWEGVALRSQQLQGVDEMNPFPSFTRVVVLAEQDSLAEAIAVAKEIRDRVAQSPALTQFAPVVLAALDRELAFYRGDYAASAAASAAAREAGGWPELGSYAELRSLLEIGDVKTMMERLPRTESFVGPGESLVAKHRLYYSGRAHELAGDTAAAVKAYQELLTAGWKAAVADIPLLADAPDRLRALEGR